MRPVVLTIAGSDSSGGAGMQADVTAIRASGAHPASVVTAITAQSTREVASIHAVPDAIVCDQLDVVLGDLPVAAAKTGMLGTVGHVEAVASRLSASRVALVVDPVLVATSGDRLAPPTVAASVRRHLFPLATVITPNLEELAVLTGRRAVTPAEMATAGRTLFDDGAAAVLVKGGHLTGPAIDVLLTHDASWALVADRIDGPPVHGTGCTLSALIACHLAFGSTLLEAARAAKATLTPSIATASRIGAGARLLAPTSLHTHISIRPLADVFRS